MAGAWLTADGHHVGAVIVLACLLAAMVWHVSAIVVMTRRARRTK